MAQELKYEIIVADSIIHDGRVMYRIKACRDIPPGIKKGDLGGYIAGYGNLAQDGDCFVADEAMAYDEARVQDNALLKDRARALHGATISGNSVMSGSSVALYNAKLLDKARLIDAGSAGVDAIIGGHATVHTDVCREAIFE